MLTIRVLQGLATVAIALALGHVVEHAFRVRGLAAGVALLRLGRLVLQVNVYRPGRAFVRLAMV